MLTAAPDRLTPRPLAAADFASLLGPLGPFGRRPRLGLAVSGGADSMALAILAHRWACAEGGQVLAFIVDHGLRPEARAEAETAAATLGAQGIASRILSLSDLPNGPGLSGRARTGRYRALAEACRRAGILHLLLGHHAADQAETLLMRALRGSGDDGLAGMAAVTETDGLRLLRPLLTVAPQSLRATLQMAGLGWAEDPTNANPHYTRARLRGLRRDAAGTGAATRALMDAAQTYGWQRADNDRAAAGFLARHATIRPEGFLRIATGGPWPADGLARAIRMLSGKAYPADPAALAGIAANPEGRIGRGLVIGGIRLLPAGRQGPGFLLCREEAAIGHPVAALPGALWDGRFRLPWRESGWPGAQIAALGEDATRFRRVSDLPAAVLRTLGCFRDAATGGLMAVPALGWAIAEEYKVTRLIFSPALPAGGSPFAPAIGQTGILSTEKMG